MTYWWNGRAVSGWVARRAAGPQPVHGRAAARSDAALWCAGGHRLGAGRSALASSPAAPAHRSVPLRGLRLPGAVPRLAVCRCLPGRCSPAACHGRAHARAAASEAALAPALRRCSFAAALGDTCGATTRSPRRPPDGSSTRWLNCQISFGPTPGNCRRYACAQLTTAFEVRNRTVQGRSSSRETRSDRTLPHGTARRAVVQASALPWRGPAGTHGCGFSPPPMWEEDRTNSIGRDSMTNVCRRPVRRPVRRPESAGCVGRCTWRQE